MTRINFHFYLLFFDFIFRGSWFPLLSSEFNFISAGFVPLNPEAGTVHLVTADGSIDCQSDPGRQESIVSDLHMAETLAALKMLTAGGNFVIKLFTIFESETVCLLYLLACSFARLEVFKPATSKEGNSEVYVICQDLTPSRWLTGQPAGGWLSPHNREEPSATLSSERHRLSAHGHGKCGASA